ncbi:phosphoserine phosphatase SerB [Curtobacterium sp. MCBD17_013]|uniref:phosphoserine phosphatase SerB n=1 Tax=Curtobacterium sp. MCBD17_013 TaxID=2175668 RepID=UPI000DA87DC9|nr:phosphoserine phosphatase SerB [Curtobacterium sp. MCBD17_013]PZF65140.1 phosphoserine phosphatase SerB [Curtobacterium sp. MCBD17_013]
MPRFLVVLDADSTLLEDEVIELLADAAGARDRVAAVTERAMRGETDFADSLRDRVATLAGLPVSVLEDVRRAVRVTTGAVELVEGVHAAGGSVGVVSGGFHEVLGPIAAALGLDHCRANRLEASGGVLTGRVLGDVVDAAAKADALRAWAAADGVDARRHTVAVGDGANDLSMMREAALAVAFVARPGVRDAADVVVDRRDLTPVLACLGVPVRAS